MPDLMARLVDDGVLLESARGPVPNVAELVAGEPIRGSWWGHPSGHDIFAAINALAASPDVVRTRLVRRKITLVHRRLWPALARLEDRFPPEALAAVAEEHTGSGAHRAVSTPFRDWVPAEALTAGSRLTVAEAVDLLPAPVRATLDGPAARPGGS
jgi:hypothetical protein